MEAWSKLWDLPELSESVSVVFSRRLTSTLARCRPAEGRIVLRADLRDAPARRLDEVLCHELAHVAVHRLHGPSAKPHGPEWQALVRAAGFQPRIRTRDASHGKRNARRAAAGRIWEHRCPVCQSVRTARRPMTAWRCAECLDAGLDGALIITRWDPNAGRAP